jgi:hypothetical protein
MDLPWTAFEKKFPFHLSKLYMLGEDGRIPWSSTPLMYPHYLIPDVAFKTFDFGLTVAWVLLLKTSQYFRVTPLTLLELLMFCVLPL